LVIVT